MTDTQISPSSTDKRSLVRTGSLSDQIFHFEECFARFQAITYPTATPIVTEAMRRCFYAGVASLSASLKANLPRDADLNEHETKLYMHWLREITTFHEQTTGSLEKHTDLVVSPEQIPR